MSLSLPGNQTGTNYAFAQVDSFETIMNYQATNSCIFFRIRNVETARITNIGLSVAPNNGNRNPTQALDVLGNAVVSGNITSPNWRVLIPVYRLTSQFPGGGNLVTIATGVAITGSGNFNIHFHCSGNATVACLNGVFELRFRNNSNGAVTSLIQSTFYFNQSGVHQQWSISRYITFISAGTYSLQLTRNATSLSHDGNDYITVIIEQISF